MRIYKTIGIALLLLVLLAGGLGVGFLLTRQPSAVNAAPPAQQETNDDDDDDEVGETEESVSPDQATISADEAKAAAEAAYPGSKALEVELEKENGVVAYEVELDNDLEVLIDPDNGDVLGTDTD